MTRRPRLHPGVTRVQTKMTTPGPRRHPRPDPSQTPVVVAQDHSSDSSEDSPSSSSSQGSGAQDDGESDGSKRKARRKKKSRKVSSRESDDEQPEDEHKADAVKVSDGSETGAKMDQTGVDSGYGGGANRAASMGASGDGLGALEGLRYMSGAKGYVPLPTSLPSMAALESLTDDLEAYSNQLFENLEQTNVEVYDKVLEGFKDTGGKSKTFTEEVGAMALAFFANVKGIEGHLAKPDATAFAEAIEASKEHIIGFIEEVSEAEMIYETGEVNFDKILESVTKEIKAYIQEKGMEQRKDYTSKSV